MAIQTVNSSSTSNRRLYSRSLKSAGAGGEDWTRPSEWPSLPAITSSDEKFVGLFAVFNHAGNFLALKASGHYTIDWGDGTTEDITGNTPCQHSYDYNNANLISTSYGYKCAIVVVTPQAGQQITLFSLNQNHTSTTQNSSIVVPWLDICLSLPNCSSITIGVSNPVCSFRFLRRAAILNLSSCNNLSYLFYYCSSLRKVEIGITMPLVNTSYMFYDCRMLDNPPLFKTQSVTDMSYMFYGCSSLRTIPFFNTAAAKNMSYMFYGCGSLRTVPLFNTAAATNMSYMFYECFSLASIPLFNTSLVTNFSYMFYNCRALSSIPLLNTVSATSMSNFLCNCSSLTSVPLFNTASVTDMSSFLSGCRSLQELPFFNTSSCTNMYYAFSSTSSVRELPAFNTSNVGNMAGAFCNMFKLDTFPLIDTSKAVDISNMLASCYTVKSIPALNLTSVSSASIFCANDSLLTSCEAFGCRYSINISFSGLGKSALELFFTNLGKAADTTQAVNIMSNSGADGAISKASSGTTAGSTTITVASTSSLFTGMICTGTGVSTGVSVTFQDSGDTVTLASHGLANGTMISFSAITSTTGISTYTNYWVVNATSDTFQVATTQGGNARALTTNGSGTLLYPAYITAIDPNVSVTLSAPASATGTVTLGFRKLDTFKATSKGWVVTG